MPNHLAKTLRRELLREQKKELKRELERNPCQELVDVLFPGATLIDHGDPELKEPDFYIGTKDEQSASNKRQPDIRKSF
jgi:hypothetical protein